MKEPVVKGVSVLRIPFGSPFTGPAKRFNQDLETIAYQCDIARNALLRHWIRWHEDHPNYQPKPILDETGTPKKNKKDEIILENPYFPYALTSSTSQESLYRKGQQVCPQLAAKIISSIAQEVVAKLKTKMPYNHGGEAKFRGQAILMNEISPDNNASRNIPVPCQDTVLAFENDFSNKLVDKLTKHYGKASCLLKFPLFANDSGRKFTSLICNLDISKFTPGQKEVVRKIAKQQWKLHDSKILFTDLKVGNDFKKLWSFNLTYIQPRKELGLNKDITATLYANPKTMNRAFQIRNNEATWQVGNKFYKVQIERLAIRRKATRYLYKSDARKGHGKGKFFNSLRPYSRGVKNQQSHFQWLAIKDIIDFCIRNNCGTLVYREPSLGLRNYNTWFAEQGLPFAWDKFRQKLAHKCHICGIELVVERIKKIEYDTVFPPATTRTTQPVVNTHVKTLRFEKGSGKKGHQAAPLATGKVKRRAVRS